MVAAAKPRARATSSSVTYLRYVALRYVGEGHYCSAQIVGKVKSRRAVPSRLVSSGRNGRCALVADIVMPHSQAIRWLPHFYLDILSINHGIIDGGTVLHRLPRGCGLVAGRSGLLRPTSAAEVPRSADQFGRRFLVTRERGVVLGQPIGFGSDCASRYRSKQESCPPSRRPVSTIGVLAAGRVRRWQLCRPLGLDPVISPGVGGPGC